MIALKISGNFASDAFGLGATLYALLCGEPPIFGNTPMQAMWAAIEAEHTSPRRARMGIALKDPRW